MNILTRLYDDSKEVLCVVVFWIFDICRLSYLQYQIILNIPHSLK